jgi:RHH-type transcriptional regulator, proline utilization regulon repressor / proline dehydrogenase / delta 1-pyrroline-5-carboxylate dehydrogenase
MSARGPLVPVEAISAALLRDEVASVAALGAPLDVAQRGAVLEFGRALVRGARARADERPYLDAFLAEFGLSNPEGIALMCLAEALLRIPDDDTADRLIAEKLATGNWQAHQGRSDSLFVNASTWGLMLTGRMVELPDDIRGDAGGWLGRFARRAGEPLVRQALRRAMQIIGSEFVVGRSIEDALARCRREPALALCSFDMLGEGARSDAQARHYLQAYANAIEAIAAATREARATGGGPHAVHAISIKLSALEPRYSLAQRGRVQSRLIPRALELARLAAQHGLGLTIDAEEADRLEISLDVIAALARDPTTRGWPGLGLAIQAYGRRAPALIDWVDGLVRNTQRQMSARLVKGAYWDSEIKRAQERGLDGYPVYTRKASTDLSYLACARQLFATGGRLYPQFATHNAHTIAAVLALRPAGVDFEFQRLHGMGTLLYDEARRQLPQLPPVRVYAPVGPHADLLAYLVRRLLENGANTSFVNRFMDEAVPVEDVVVDPIAATAVLTAQDGVAPAALPLPAALYGAARANSRGVDFGRGAELAALAAMATPRAPSLAPRHASGAVRITNPADRRELVGALDFATAADVAAAFAAAAAAQPDWDLRGGATRAALLERAADAIELARSRFVHLLVREAGKTLPDAIAEIREAADFCRYYAAEARELFGAPQALAGPTGESNELSLHGRGVLACISPWNFPLAIFTGQVAAALAAGNAVLAKPAESTPLVAAAVVDLLHEIGVPRDVLHLLPMAGREFGDAALRDPRLAGVVFTGSTRTAQWLNRALAARDGAILPLIAETGGINAMLVDSTALLEQVVDDVIASAFGSAGQRCSALRLLCVQEDVADRLLELLEGAMDELGVGDPADPSTDVGPVISEAAAVALEAHVERMRGIARVRRRVALDQRHAHGSFVAPTLVELDSVGQLDSEQFGPILHVVRYRSDQLGELLAAIRGSGYALTLGVQTRIEGFWREVFAATTSGNVYVNRNMIGAVVGVQPFGGSGLSGTVPKAGGPHYLPRLAIERTLTVNTTAAGGNTQLLQAGG